MPKKILCAVDGSDASDRAAACAGELAMDTGAKLTFVHVNNVPQDRIAKLWFWDETLLSAVNAQIQARLANGQKIAANHHGIAALTDAHGRDQPGWRTAQPQDRRQDQRWQHDRGIQLAALYE